MALDGPLAQHLRLKLKSGAAMAAPAAPSLTALLLYWPNMTAMITFNVHTISKRLTPIDHMS